MKKCSRCKQEKQKSEFCKDRSEKDGLNRKCKICKKELDKKTRENNIDYYVNYDRNRWLSINRSFIVPAKKRARIKGLGFNIDESDVVVPIFCPILGIKLERNIKNSSFNSPSLDRIDSTKGYVKGNVWIISHLANTMKNHATPEQLINFANWILSCYTKPK